MRQNTRANIRANDSNTELYTYKEENSNSNQYKSTTGTGQQTCLVILSDVFSAYIT